MYAAAVALTLLTTSALLGSDWRFYGGEAHATKYSVIAEIHAENVKSLRIAWRWRSVDESIVSQQGLRTWLFQATPLAIGGTLYTSTSLGQVAAIDGVTGRTIWVYDPEAYKSGYPPVYGFVHRGVSYWREGADERIYVGTPDSHLIALNAKTGKPIPSFGSGGRVDLLTGLTRTVNRRKISVTSPPVICRGVVVVGTALGDGQVGPSPDLPPGDLQGFDVRTGKRLWRFRSVPVQGEFGYETWMNGSADSPRGVSAWPPLSADEELGLIYVPFSSPSNDYYGGNRPGQNLFGSSIVCLKAKTGERVWHFQLAHHDLWDYDPPAAPILADLNSGGKKRKVVVQLTKQGFCFVLDRATGQPIWPIREVPVPQSDAPHERTSATQPIPSKPAPFDRQGTASDAELIDFTPELRKEAQSILGKYKRGPLYSPPSFQGTIAVPGAQGGASWAGGALDPESGMLYVPSATRPYVMKLSESSVEANKDRPSTSDRLRGSRMLLMGPDNLPLFKPPFGRITAIDLNAGKHRWMIPSGDGPRNHPRLRGLELPPLGWPLRTFVLLTKTLLFAVQEGPVEQERMIDGHLVAEHSSREAKLRAYDKKTGKLIAEIEMPLNASGSPMTYLAGGRQYIVVAVGGSNLPAELIAYRTE